MTDKYFLYSPDKETVVLTTDYDIDAHLNYAIKHEADGIHHLVVDYDQGYRDRQNGWMMRWYGIIEFNSSGHPQTRSIGGGIHHVLPDTPHWPRPEDMARRRSLELEPLLEPF